MSPQLLELSGAPENNLGASEITLLSFPGARKHKGATGSLCGLPMGFRPFYILLMYRIVIQFISTVQLHPRYLFLIEITS